MNLNDSINAATRSLNIANIGGFDPKVGAEVLRSLIEAARLQSAIEDAAERLPDGSDTDISISVNCCGVGVFLTRCGETVSYYPASPAEAENESLAQAVRRFVDLATETEVTE